MNKMNQSIVLGLTLITVGGSIAPVTNVFASEKATNFTATNEFDKYYNDLSNEKKVEFERLVSGAHLSQVEQLQILKEKYESDRQLTPRWKIAVIKKIAKWLVAKTGEKTVSDVTNYLFEWQDNLEQGAENWLVNHGWNRTAAHWTVKTASFIFL